MKDSKKSISKKAVIIIVSFCLLVVLFVVGAAVLPWISYEVIEGGFDSALCTMLSDEYSVTVPGDAELIKGKHTGFNDTYLTLFFKLPANGKEAREVIDMILDSEVWSNESEKSLSENDKSYAEMTMDHYRENYNEAYSSLHYSDVSDGYVYVLFKGWRPSMKGVDTKIKIDF